ncbi:MAG: spore germination protein [Gorillibacterium sp.]|nr:spore germination protein [Gorillibacterium sp.]
MTDKDPDNSADAKPQSTESESLSPSLEKTIDLFKRIFVNDETLRTRMIHNQHDDQIRVGIIYIEGMIDKAFVHETIIRPVMNIQLASGAEPDVMMSRFRDQVISANNVTESEDVDTLVDAIISGDTVFVLDGYQGALIISSQGWKARSISTSETEKNLKGPQEAFTESLLTNLTLLRRKIKQSDLKFRFQEIGTRTHTRISICYLQSLASEKILKELGERLDRIDIDGILDSGYIQELISDEPYSPFETIGNTERPDVVAGRLLEGRIAVFVDGSPVVLTVPYLFVEAFQVSEDYYIHYIQASFNRCIRVLGAFISVSVPAIFIAILTYNQEMIPTQLLISISAARISVPFPTIVEAFMMLAIFEILTEAGARMPTPIGQTASIVGGLVLGQAAVEARIVSAPMVIVVGITGITALLNVKLRGPAIIARVIFLILASILGLYGYFIGILGLIVHLMGLYSFGVPYMLTIGNISPEVIKDTILRGPWWGMKLRTPVISGKNRKRMASRKRG